MRIVQILLTGLAVLAAIIGGIFTMAVAAITVLVVFVTRRLFGKPRPAIASTPRPRRPSVPRRTSSADVIEVSATEVSDSRPLH